MTDDKPEEVFEYQILAAALTVPGAIEKFSKEIEPTSVGLIHGLTGIHEIYKSLLSYHKNIDTPVVDPIGFKAWLHDESDVIEAIGGQSNLDKFIDQVLTVEVSSVDSIIKLTNFRANKRKQLDKLNELKVVIANKGQASDTELAKISSLTDQIRLLENDLNRDPFQSVRTGAKIAADIDLLWESVPFLPTQFKDLNKAIGYSEEFGGIPRGCVTTIAALSGYGKSTLAKCFCNHWLDNGHTVLFINFEEARQHWERTLMTQVVKKNIYAETFIMSSENKAKLSKRFQDKMYEWGDRLMVRHDPETLFFEDLEKWLRDILGYGARKPDAVIIDTIQSMFTRSGGKARWGEFEQIMVGLEKLAKDMDAAIIVTAQQNINSVKEKREEVNQSDMGGSVTITQKSSVTLFLTPVKDASGDDTIHANIMQVQIPKNRIAGTVFSGSPPLLKYDDSIKSYVPYEIVYDHNDGMIPEYELGDTY